MKFIAIYFGLLIFLFSCTDNGDNRIKYHKNGKIAEMTIFLNTNNGEKILYSFYENGQLKEVKNLKDNDTLSGERLWFYPSGILSKNIQFKEGLANGNAYFFYDTSGALKSFRYYRNDKEVLFGSDFWGDSVDVMKSSLHFNDSGHIYYKKNFNRNGELVDEEGKRNN